MVDRNSVYLALEEMVKYGSDLTQLHTLTAYFSFPTEAAARQAAAELKRREGVECTCDLLPPPWWQALFVRPRWAVRGTRPLIPTADEIIRLTDVCNAVAEQCGGVYARWEAKLVR
ncbi:MAG TPA: ribonuclease E inhibitor RraB [Armatimonadota bacterium]|nr:ribonuclease E inhibitor RraB [Armatimonadota bacterium]HOS42657.1 ribonuclease E inhibitor RraB [Armatimonadota bacterium]